MKIIEKEEIIEFVEKKSKFIGYIKPVKSVKEAREYIESIRQKHSDATHNVPLYRVIENKVEYFKYSDDNEPNNTAGKPMADIVERKEIYNIAMVATRYFGGVKLGAGGLIRAYANVAKLLINKVKIEEYVERFYVILLFEYSNLSHIERIISSNNMEIIEKSYLDKISFKLFITKQEIELFKVVNNIDIVEL
ncbi:IMPACT family protein [Caviibacter abscessus]|uniref:IMPACT family protein n=1 Tax=Caviibacter abscessus TaxID=1766719 RepID=UPI00082EE845|nr:YigZ family protein [Caviibacter abscessus]